MSSDNYHVSGKVHREIRLGGCGGLTTTISSHIITTGERDHREGGSG